MFRVLPITILFLAAFVAFKTYTKAVETDIVKDGFAEDSERVELETAESLQAIEPASGDVAETEEPAEGEEVAEAEEADSDLPSYVSRDRPEENIPELTESGVKLLKQMSARRVELEEWKQDLDMRASLIEASSRKLDDKIAQLEKLKTATQTLLDEFKIEDDKQIQSMVKIYENMKPKEAAKVFNQLELPILLEIVQQMNERRVSPILAKMNAARAKEVTEQILENRDLAGM